MTNPRHRGVRRRSHRPKLEASRCYGAARSCWVSPFTFGTVFAAFVTVTETEPDVAMFPEPSRELRQRVRAIGAVAVFQESVYGRSVTSTKVRAVQPELHAGNADVVRRGGRNRDCAADRRAARGRAQRHNRAFTSADVANESATMSKSERALGSRSGRPGRCPLSGNPKCSAILCADVGAGYGRPGRPGCSVESWHRINSIRRC